MEGLEKLEKEVAEMDNPSVTAVFEFLKTRTDLYDKFNNEEKSAKQMWDFIWNKAEKQKVNNVAMIADNLVYMWAVTYFIRSNEELKIQEQKVTKSAPIESTKKNEEKDKQQESKNEKPQDNQITLFEEVQK